MSPTILVVDDDDDVRTSMLRILERAGYEVIQAGSVPEARALADQQTPDLMIMDMVLPGLEGREGANLILARHPSLPILFVSGYTNPESMRMGQGGENFLRKPFTVEELVDAVERVLLGQRPSGAG
jgi:two-component system, cell cycle sensor histidine kinase and response regulator CckA